MPEGGSTDGKVEKSLAYCVPMQLSLGMDPPIPVPDIAGRNKRICREEDTDNMRLEERGNTRSLSDLKTNV